MSRSVVIGGLLIVFLLASFTLVTITRDVNQEVSTTTGDHLQNRLCSPEDGLVYSLRSIVDIRTKVEEAEIEESTELELELHLRGVLGKSQLVVQDVRKASLGDGDRSGLDALIGSQVGIVFDRDCSIQKIQLPQAISSKSRSVLLSLVYALDIRVLDGRSWKTKQFDATGQYVGMYRIVGDRTVERRKSGYERTFADTRAIGLSVASRLSANFANDGWIDTVIQEEQYSTSVGGREIISVVSKLVIERTGKTINRDRQLEFGESWTQLSDQLDLAGFDEIDGIEEWSKNRVRTLEEIENILIGSDRLQAVANAHIVAESLRSNKRLVREVYEEIISSDSMPEKIKPALFLSLRLAGTEETRKVLRDIAADSKVAVADRLRSINAIRGLESPKLIDIQMLIDASENHQVEGGEGTVARSSILALASIARRDDISTKLRSEVDESSHIVIEKVLQSGEKSLALEAIGNCGNLKYLPVVRESFGEDDTVVRSAAVSALRYYGLEYQEDVLSSRLEDEPDDRVLWQMIDQLRLSSEEYDVPLSEKTRRISVEMALGGIENDRVRYSLIQLIGGFAADTADARRQLEELYQREEDPRIRTLIGTYIDVGGI